MLKDQIHSDIITAMKAGETLKKDALKMIKAEIMKLEVSGADVVADDEAVTKILSRAVKQRKEAAEGFQKGGNQEAADKELEEAEIYKAYLPEMMGEEEITKAVQAIIEQVGATGPSDMGKVMQAVMQELGGKADGSLVKTVVMNTLNE
jgi:uncharacterized protein YqeY